MHPFRLTPSDPSLPIARYAGTYSDRLFGRVGVERADGGTLRVTHGGLTGSLEHWHYDTFRLRWDARWRGGGLVTFVLDAAGEIDRLEVGRRVFHRREEERAGEGG